MLKLITLLLTSSMTVMAGATIAPALPKIQEFFAIPLGSPDELQVKLLLTIPALFTAIGGILAGLIIDRWGRKWPLAGAVLLYGLAGSSGLWLNGIEALLIGRAFLGLAVAMITTASATLIADYFQGPQRTRILGFQAAAMGFGGVIFLLLGGAIASYSWRLPFLIYLFAFIILPLVLQLPEPHRTDSQHFELPNQGNQTTLSIGTIVTIYSLTITTMMIFYMVPVQLPFYLKAIGFGGSWEAGLAIAVCTLASAIASLGYARLKNHLSFSKVMMCLFCLMASGYGIIANAPTYSILILGLILAGSGLGFLLPNMNVWLNAKTPPAQRGQILGGLTSCIFLGQFCSPLVVQPIAQNFGLQSAYAIAAGILFLLGLLIATKLVLSTPSVTPRSGTH
jgi:MFS family permease